MAKSKFTKTTVFHKKLEEMEDALRKLAPHKNEKSIRNSINRVVSDGVGCAPFTVERWRKSPRGMSSNLIEKVEKYFNATYTELQSEINTAE